jgi:hypothetical protein
MGRAKAAAPRGRGRAGPAGPGADAGAQRRAGERPPRLSRHLEGLADQAVAADQPAVAQAVSQAREALAQAPDAQSAEATLAGVAQTLATLAAPPAVVPVPAPAEASDDDDDMREVFLEEARSARPGPRGPGAAGRGATDLDAMTTGAAAFHTLKGSSRMVGLRPSAKPPGPASSSTTPGWPRRWSGRHAAARLHRPGPG